MECPYITDCFTIEETTNDFEDGCCKSGTTITKNFVTPHNCLREDCAAWNDGRCAYRGR